MIDLCKLTLAYFIIIYICNIISSLETQKQFWIYLLLVQQQPTGSASMADNRNDDIAINLKQKHMHDNDNA